ncbi:hypothetical protein B0H13DRAFT_2389777, partial [Mycena leptocephala]
MAPPPSNRPLTRSKSVTAPAVPAAAQTLSTPSEGKTPISSLHFNKDGRNTYTGTTVKPSSSATRPSVFGCSSNSFAPLATDAGTTIDEEIVADLIGMDYPEGGESLGGDISSSDLSVEDIPASSSTPRDTVKDLARKLAKRAGPWANPPAGASSTPTVPFSSLVAAAFNALDKDSPFLAPTATTSSGLSSASTTEVNPSPRPHLLPLPTPSQRPLPPPAMCRWDNVLAPQCLKETSRLAHPIRTSPSLPPEPSSNVQPAPEENTPALLAPTVAGVADPPQPTPATTTAMPAGTSAGVISAPSFAAVASTPPSPRRTRSKTRGATKGQAPTLSSTTQQAGTTPVQPMVTAPAVTIQPAVKTNAQSPPTVIVIAQPTASQPAPALQPAPTAATPAAVTQAEPTPAATQGSPAAHVQGSAAAAQLVLPDGNNPP